MFVLTRGSASVGQSHFGPQIVLMDPALSVESESRPSDGCTDRGSSTRSWSPWVAIDTQEEEMLSTLRGQRPTVMKTCWCECWGDESALCATRFAAAPPGPNHGLALPINTTVGVWAAAFLTALAKAPGGLWDPLADMHRRRHCGHVAHPHGSSVSSDIFRHLPYLLRLLASADFFFFFFFKFHLILFFILFILLVLFYFVYFVYFVFFCFVCFALFHYFLLFLHRPNHRFGCILKSIGTASEKSSQ